MQAMDFSIKKPIDQGNFPAVKGLHLDNYMCIRQN